ncbi:hypothetical protein ACELLULO517_02120 [Acidisoma cellulosilytica]|uniref:Uncharacterized protein n=1 Tax=Acidisoma cellulosilyticum TaxID=2802395 RepID=A0A964E283_9PROT|nr:DUF6134 family protein [Acidisoma cellulosilyticum]MCB8879014.1 hypothetical protein [Acidisoma cellulosilyticum]
MGAASAALLATGSARAQVVPPSGQLAFDLIREGSHIGRETVRFEQSGNRLTATVDVSIRVTLAMIPVYRLHHHETETWDNGRLLSFAATTQKNGRNFYAQGWQAGDNLMVRGTAHPEGYQAPPGALPTSQWNHDMLRGPMINTEDGRLMHPTVTSAGDSQVALADGRKIPARQFNARGDLHFDTYFSETWEWVGLSFRAGDGSFVTYAKL